MNRFYSINLNKEKWSNVNENIWFYPTKRDYKYRIPIEEIPYFLFWLSKSKNLRDYFKNIAFEFDLTKYGIYFGYFKSNLNPEDYPKTMYNKYQKQNYHNKKIILKTLINSFDCEILYFKALGYSMLGYFCAKMKSSEKFQKYYMNALELKKQQGNLLEDDFDRIFSCDQIEIDLEHGSMQTVEDQFNELFSDEFRRK